MEVESTVASDMLETETYVNIAGYRFIDLSDRDELRAPFLEICLELELNTFEYARKSRNLPCANVLSLTGI